MSPIPSPSIRSAVARGRLRDQRQQPLGGGELPAPRDKKLAEQAREISRRQQRTERAEALVERQTKWRRRWERR